MIKIIVFSQGLSYAERCHLNEGGCDDSKRGTGNNSMGDYLTAGISSRTMWCSVLFWVGCNNYLNDFIKKGCQAKIFKNGGFDAFPCLICLLDSFIEGRKSDKHSLATTLLLACGVSYKKGIKPDFPTPFSL